MEEPHIDPATIVVQDGQQTDDTNAQIKQLCLKLLPHWHALSLEDLSLEPISGGISNLLVKVTPAIQHGLPPVAFKVFGNKTELLIDRDAERKVLVKLNKFGFGAKVLGMFSNGRIEEFLTARTLTPQDMGHPDYVPRIAATLQRLHTVPTDGRPTLWPTIFRWYDMAKQLRFDDADKQGKYAKIQLSAMLQQIAETKAICDQMDSPVVFSHNDLLSGNILIVEGKLDPHDSTVREQSLGGPSMQFIDYEYSACGFRGFDLGNHFNEYAGFECDYSRYPDTQQQHLFFRHYLQAGSTGRPDPSSEQLERLEAETNVFALASHIYWGVWALIQARYSPIDFDYLEYSTTRWQEYYRRKDEFLNKAKAVLLKG